MFYRDFISLKFLDASPEKRDYKSTVLNNASNLYNNELIPEYRKVYESGSKNNKSYGWKQKYDLRNLKDLDYQPAKLKTESLSDEDKSGLKQLMKLKQINLNEISKALWIKASGNDLNFLIKDAVKNLDSNNYKTTLDSKKNGLKNAEKFLVEIFTKNVPTRHATL